MLKKRWGKDVNRIQANNCYPTILIWDVRCYFIVEDDIVLFIWVWAT